MDTNGIIAEIDSEILRLQQAKALLTGTGAGAKPNGPGRPRSTAPEVSSPKKRKMSKQGRAAISAAMKARWAKVRKESKSKSKSKVA